MRIVTARTVLLLFESRLLLTALVIMMLSGPYFMTCRRIIKQATELLSARKAPGSATSRAHDKPPT